MHFTLPELSGKYRIKTKHVGGAVVISGRKIGLLYQFLIQIDSAKLFLMKILIKQPKHINNRRGAMNTVGYFCIS